MDGLEKISEESVDKEIIPNIDQLTTPFVQGSRLKKLIKAVKQASSVSWDRKKRGIVDDEETPLPSEELRRLEALFFARYKLRIPAEEDLEKQRSRS